jgi:hypothetical protein
LFTSKPLNTATWAAVLIIYAGVVFAGILHHELWFDECQTYLYARSSRSLSQLFYNVRFEGQPAFWHVLLYAITRFSANPFYMQVLNAVLSCIAAWIFLRYSPFSFLFKLLFIFGYFMIYEYSIISREYALGCACLFAVLSLNGLKQQNGLLTTLALAMLANTHPFFTIISIAFVSYLILKSILYEKQSKADRKVLFFTIIMTVAGIALGIYTAAPSIGYLKLIYSSQAVFSMEQFRKVYATPFRGIFNLPDFTTNYSWNTNLFTDHFWRLNKLFFVLPAILAFVLLYKKPLALFFFLLSALGIMLGEYACLSTATRHSGIIYLSFIAALWLSYDEPDKEWLRKPFWLNKLFNSIIKPASIVVWLILTLQIAGGCILYIKDFNQPFSESREVSNYLLANSLANQFIMVSNQSKGPPVSTNLNREVFYTEANRAGTFCFWDVTPWFISDSAVICRVNQQLIEHDSIILLLDHPIQPAIINDGNMVLLKAFDRAFVRSENYWVYLIKRK